LHDFILCYDCRVFFVNHDQEKFPFMKHVLKSLIFCSALSAFATQAIAEDLDIFEEWSSNLELGFVQTGGNTQVRSLSSKGKLVNESTSLRTSIEGAALNTTDKNNTTAEKYHTSLQEDWKFTVHDYMFGRIGFNTDRFGGFKRRISETLGYGRVLIKNEELQWNAELGAGARQSTFTTNIRKNEVIGRTSTNMEWQISDSAKFIQQLKTEGGKEGFASHSLTALQNKINGSLSSKISYSADHTSKVPAGTRKMDTEISIALVWSH